MASSFVFAAKKTKPAPMPDWINTPATVYPSSAFITYVGEGADRNKAEITAINGIASIFSQSIKSDSSASTRMEQAKKDGKVATAQTSAFSQEILRSVDVDFLIGVEIKEFWFDGNATWYAIAVLDKAKATDIYVDMIQKNSSAIQTLLKNASKDILSIEAYAAYDFAQDIALENEKHLQKLSVINSARVQNLKDSFISSKKLAAQKLEIAKQIPIFVSVADDENGKIKSAFFEVISKIGFRATSDDDVRYVLEATVLLEETAATDGKTTRCRYNLDAHILDTDTNQKFAPFSAKGREGHSNYTEAKNRAVASLVKKVSNDFSNTFSDYLKNFVSD